MWVYLIHFIKAQKYIGNYFWGFKMLWGWENRLKTPWLKKKKKCSLSERKIKRILFFGNISTREATGNLNILENLENLVRSKVNTKSTNNLILHVMWLFFSLDFYKKINVCKRTFQQYSQNKKTKSAMKIQHIQWKMFLVEDS